MLEEHAGLLAYCPLRGSNSVLILSLSLSLFISLSLALSFSPNSVCYKGAKLYALWFEVARPPGWRKIVAAYGPSQPTSQRTSQRTNKT